MKPKNKHETRNCSQGENAWTDEQRSPSQQREGQGEGDEGGGGGGGETKAGSLDDLPFPSSASGWCRCWDSDCTHIIQFDLDGGP